jgi:hypothetical protein
MKERQPFVGPWRIRTMEVWSPDAFDLLGPAHFTFQPDGLGTFRFIAVEGDMDCRFGHRDGKPLVEFSWEGGDDGDPMTGRGWAVVDGEVLRGHIFLHGGDDSAFTATREVVVPSRQRRRQG